MIKYKIIAITGSINTSCNYLLMKPELKILQRNKEHMFADYRCFHWLHLPGEIAIIFKRDSGESALPDF